MVVVPVVVVEAFEDEDGSLSIVRKHLNLEQIRGRIVAIFAFSIHLVGLCEMVWKAVGIVEDGLSALLIVYPVPEIFATLRIDVETNEDALVVQPVRLMGILHPDILDHLNFSF